MTMTEIAAAKGYTPLQVALFEQRYCTAQGHRFTPFNVPTPDGTCPFCADQAFRDAMSHAGMPDVAPDAALTPADIAAVVARNAASVSTPQTLTAALPSNRMARVQRHRTLRRSVARRSVG